MSPYIVSQQRRDRFDVMGPDRDVWAVLSRVAVGSLESHGYMHNGLKDEVARILLRHGVVQQGQEWARIILSLDHIADGAWSVDLPDGTRIEVEAKEWAKLSRDLGSEPWRGGETLQAHYDRTLAEWNEKCGVRS